MSRILICSLLAAVLSAGPPAITSLFTRPTHALPTGPMAQAWADVGPPSRQHLDWPDIVRPRRQFGWPLPGSPTVVRAFHPPEFRFGPGHRGVDLATVAGAPVLAAGAGTVLFAGTVAGRGVVSVSHPGGLRTTYEPVSATVTAGQRVAKGERIGAAQPGHPGCPVAVCLHWGAFRDPERSGPRPAGPDSGREYLDPLRLINAVPVRLLPLGTTPHQS
ncbi:MAG: M23 family metallopeptidase [Pseudonocardiaceae bacterium]